MPLANVTEDQKKLRLFVFTLIGRPKYWLLYLPNGTIQTWDELENQVLAEIFPYGKVLGKEI